MLKQKKGKPIGVYVSAKERKQAERAAYELGLSLSDYMRTLHRKYWSEEHEVKK